MAGHVVAVPAGHDRRVDRPAGRVLDRARAGRCRSPRARPRCGAASASSSAITGSTQPSTPLGPVGDVEVGAPLGQDRSRRGRRAPRVAWVAPRSTPATTRARGVEGEQRRRPAAGRDAAAERRHEPEPHQQRRSGRRSSSGPARWPRRAAARVRGCPSRSSSKTSLVRTTGSEPRGDFRTSSKQLLPDSRQKCVTRATVTPCAVAPPPPPSRQPRRLAGEVVLRARG